MKWLIHTRLQKVLQNYNLIPNEQVGFQQKRSTEEHLAYILNEILKTLFYMTWNCYFL